MNGFSNTRILTECAVLIALGTVLAQIKILRMPSDGSVTLLSMLLDYVLAYTVLGLASLFALPKKNRALGVAAGTLVVCFFRFLCALLSGFLIWGSLTDGVWDAFVYSLGYNASYMVPETLLTVAGAYLLAKTAYDPIFRPQK